MMDKLRVRVYNVRFGDAILISVPDRTNGGATVMRHILIDFGNVASSRGAGGEDSILLPVFQDILQVLDNRPLDLYVMTHEHLDHVQGLLYAFRKLGVRLPVSHAWLTASSAPDYYETHPKAKKQFDEARAAFENIAHFFAAAPEAPSAKSALWDALLLNNNPQHTSDCVQFLRELAPNHTAYVHRQSDLSGTHPFREADLKIWAPEEDTADYFRSLLPMALGITPGQGENAKPMLSEVTPPAGVDAGAFYDLVEARRRSYSDNLLAIDRAANDTSVVFSLTWRQWKLLFTGDAEQKSWRMMDQQGLLEPIHFLKVGHHASANGTPPPELLEKILPKAPPDKRHRSAAVSTWENTYNGVPDEDTLTNLKHRCQVKSTLTDLPPKAFFLDFEFRG